MRDQELLDDRVRARLPRLRKLAGRATFCRLTGRRRGSDTGAGDRRHPPLRDFSTFYLQHGHGREEHLLLLRELRQQAYVRTVMEPVARLLGTLDFPQDVGLLRAHIALAHVLLD